MNCVFCKSEIEEEDEICRNCKNKKQKTIEEQQIMKYFKDGHTYEEMCKLLNMEGYKMSIRTLKRRCKKIGLTRKNSQSRDEVREAITKEIDGPCSQMGYRTMWHHLRSARGFFTSRDAVMHMAREVNPDGVRIRQRKKLHRRTYHSLGPNDCWHMDGYDKLKPFGFPIHGCVDGYSRKILWLELLYSNNNPVNIASLYVNALRRDKKIPRRLRTDCGTENGLAAGIQEFLRRNCGDALASSGSHIYGSSHSNQRIEAWWSQLRKSQTTYAINFFRNLAEEMFNVEDVLHKSCAWFCFGPLLRKNLSEFKDQWNSHYIRKSQYSNVHGRPNFVYVCPGDEKSDQSFIVNDDDLVGVDEYLNSLEGNDTPDYEIYFEYFQHVVDTQRITMGNNSWTDAETLFKYLLNNAV